jgi:hypothetical protein
MKRTAINFWLDLVAFLLMVGLALTGGITHYVLPSGTGNWLTLLGLGRRDYGQIHFYLGFAVVILLALHLAMHWSWLCGFVAKRLGKDQPSRRARILAGLGAVAVVGLLLVGGLAWAASRVEDRFGAREPGGRAPSEAVPHQDEEDCPAAPAINGRMTVEGAADAAGLSPAELLRALGVSHPVDPQERLGRLRRQFGISMQEVRRLVCRRH